MVEIQSSPARTPGIVLFVAILNFLSASAGFLIALVSLLVTLLGASAGVYEQVSNQLSQNQPPISMTFGVTLFFVLLVVVSLIFGAFFLSIGIGLLKRKRIAWYVQVALSVLGLLGFPFGTVVNGLILAFFFQPQVRNHYNV